MIVSGSNNLSYDSDDEVEKNEVDTYRRKYQLLLERCEVLQQDNERLVHRIQQVRKMLWRSRKERKFLMDRLDQHGDNWRNVQLPIPLDEPLNIPTTTKPDKNQHQKLGAGTTAKSASSVEKGGRKITSTTVASSGTKRKSGKSADKPERDPNAPKRPANPFFQFCQEQRPIVMERLGLEQKSGEAEPSKQELTRQLASKWNTLPPEDKKIYYDMYEKSKEKYAVEMQIYSNRTKPPNEDIST
ncbi:non-histone protein 10 isoform X2 [Zootermopsis nevadensis]|uniref:Non-histone protein 10 n=1 Tax=Zootermopsis nevadensis TaxID=136037 RepID=A0A067QJQ9_ZOONE|nr:non-histone protein 10 isoform X2 [Zootermopsis nevadensis]KDR09064.1 Non-histone protein 10 [Zootermopsis nevadensis]